MFVGQLQAQTVLRIILLIYIYLGTKKIIKKHPTIAEKEFSPSLFGAEARF